MPDIAKRTFDIEGQMVTCHELGDDRLWACPCDDFTRRLAEYGEGFCAHTAVAMMQTAETSGSTGDEP